MDTKCENCKFWEPKESDVPATGLCHRYAPRPLGTHPVKSPESMDAIWPRTKGEGWCGEWQAKVELHEAD
jgi:hypothetical protein